MKRREKRLSLCRETVRELGSRDLPVVVGGETLRCGTYECTHTCFITVCGCEETETCA